MADPDPNAPPANPPVDGSTVTDNTDIHALLEKGDGVLTKRGNVWTYPGALNDPSGTNLRLPIEYVTDKAVQDLLREGKLVAIVAEPNGQARSVGYAPEDGSAHVAITADQVGSAAAGTELPTKRPELDAGTTTISPQQALENAKKVGEAVGAVQGNGKQPKR